MNNLKRALYLSVLWLLVSVSASARQDSTMHINTIVERTQLIFENLPIEKVHLHFDKPYYAVGDTVWFKGYLSTNLYNYEPSKIMYVEVMTERDSLIQVLKLPLVDQVGKGQLVLDQQWFGQGNYRFRAYSKWMANFDPDYFLHLQRCDRQISRLDKHCDLLCFCGDCIHL